MEDTQYWDSEQNDVIKPGEFLLKTVLLGLLMGSIQAKQSILQNEGLSSTHTAPNPGGKRRDGSSYSTELSQH